MKTLTNETLKQILENDGAGFNLIIDEYGSLVKAIARSYLRSQADVDEAASEVWMKVYEKRFLIRDIHRFPGWLSRVVRNTCLNMLKSRKRYRKYHVLTGFPSKHEAISTFVSNDYYKMFELNEMKQFVNQVLDIMEELYRVPLHLYYREDMSVKEISQALAISESNVKWRLHQGRNLFRKNARRLMLFRKENCT